MNSRERVFRTLNFEQADRLPIDFWMSSGFSRKLTSALGLTTEDFLNKHDVDLRYIDGPIYIGPPLSKQADGSGRDIWGVGRKTVSVPTANGMETYDEAVLSPLESATVIEQINDYAWPSPDWFDYSPIAGQCRKIREQGQVAVFEGDRLNRIAQLKPAMYLRGMENILIDVIANPEIAHAIFKHIRTFYHEYAQRVFEAAQSQLDIVLTGDDFGSQHGPLLSPAMWSEFLGEGFAEYVALAHSYDLRVMHHTCGSVRAIIPLMLERGLDILQSLQPEASDMEPDKLKADFGKHLAFHGGISIQRTLPFGSPADIRAEVKNCAETLGAGGGYILCTSHNIQADVPVENALALLKAYQDYGYPT